MRRNDFFASSSFSKSPLPLACTHFVVLSNGPRPRWLRYVRNQAPSVRARASLTPWNIRPTAYPSTAALLWAVWFPVAHRIIHTKGPVYSSEIYFTTGPPGCAWENSCTRSHKRLDVSAMWKLWSVPICRLKLWQARLAERNNMCVYLCHYHADVALCGWKEKMTSPDFAHPEALKVTQTTRSSTQNRKLSGVTLVYCFLLSE